MARFVFYCRDTPSNLRTFEYYTQDIEALRALGHTVVVCTRYREIPRSFDAMFVWWWNYALAPALLCRLLGKPCLITGVFNFRFPPDFDGVDYFGRPAWQQWLIRAAARMATLNLFIDDDERRACASYFGLTNTRHFPCSTHRDYLQGPSDDRQLVLFNLAWSGRQNLIRKGIPELLGAIRLLLDQGVAVTAKLAGKDGDGRDYLIDLVKASGLEEHVFLLGALSRDDKIRLLRSCEIYVQPSHYEGFGLAMAEAMGSGACVITCDVGAVRTVVGDAGLYVAPGSPKGLADAIRIVMEDSDLRYQLQDKARQRALLHFAPEAKLLALKGYLAAVGVNDPESSGPRAN